MQLRYPQEVGRLTKPAPITGTITTLGRCYNRSPQIFVVPFRGKQAIPPSDWIPVTDVAHNEGFSWWSPGGNLLYFISNRDRFACIWAQALDPATRRPVGPPRSIHHVHEPRRFLSRLPPGELKVSVARDRLVFAVEEVTGDIWLRPARR